MSRIETLRVAIVAALDTAAALVALTGRASANVVAWDDLDAEGPFPVVAYQVVSMERSSMSGDSWRARVQFTAVASTEALANELIAAVDVSLTTSTLAALPQPLDACRLSIEEQLLAVSLDDVAELERADFDAILLVTF
jgi:hypothetical protein